jgi:light-regulated signal transduction histidine kinase (bacteriophytochrome)
VTDRTAQLEAANRELEAFSYSVSHDLKGPVRRIDSIARAFIEDYFLTLDDTEKDFLKKINESASSMNVLIDELLKLSRIMRHDIDKMQVNISEIARDINHEIKKLNPGRKVRLMIQEGLLDYCDPKLIRIVFQNLFDNAWKYSGKEKESVIEFSRTIKDGKSVYLVRDNGVGFDMAYYDKLFTPFQRLHSDDQFTGTGIGLATVKRIIVKHGGLIWAESSPGEGTRFYFTLYSGS